MKNLLFNILLFFATENTYCRAPDSTLESIFEHFHPNHLRTLAQSTHRFEVKDLTEYYLVELSFKIPMLNPISNQKVNSKFGYRIHPVTGEIKKHQGIDLAGKSGQPIYAAADGYIIASGSDRCLGNYLKIKHLFNFVTTYGHLQNFLTLPENTHVYQGQVIGTCGSTGRTTGVHLHFAITWKNEFLNPYPFIF